LRQRGQRLKGRIWVVEEVPEEEDGEGGREAHAEEKKRG